jgi:hypothetical protein
MNRTPDNRVHPSGPGEPGRKLLKIVIDVISLMSRWHA